MDSKPKSFAEAIEKLEKSIDSTGGDLRARLERELKDLKTKATDEFGAAKEKIEVNVQKHPWAALGIVALLAFILGLIFSPRGSRRSD